MKQAVRLRLISLSVALLLLLVAAGVPVLTVKAQSNPTLTQPEPAVVQIAQWATIRQDGVASDRKQPVGSGSIISPGGLILTNHHVIDTTAFGRNLEAESNDLERQGHEFTYSLVEDRYVILTGGLSGVPVATYTASVVVDDPVLDLAVLRIDGGPQGEPIALSPLPYLELGNSDLARRGDRVRILGFPGGVASLFTSSAEIGSLSTDPGVVGWAWFIVSGGAVSGGSSGGPALDATGHLIAVTTSVLPPDCRPVSDTNGDGIIDQADGCVATGGDFTRLRPVNLALPLLLQADPARFSLTPVAPPATATVSSILVATSTPALPSLPTSTPTPSPTPSPTPTPTPPLPLEQHTSIPLASLLPDQLLLPQGQPFQLYSEGAAVFDDVYANLPDPAQARNFLISWGWQENAYRVYTSDNPPPDATGWVELSVDRFSSADGAAAALPYYAAARREDLGDEAIYVGLFGDQTEAMSGQAINGEEVTIYARRANLLLRATGIAPHGDPTTDVYEALLIPLGLLVDEPNVVSPDLFATLPQAFDLPPDLTVSEEHARSAAAIAASFPNPPEAERLFQEWGWRESAARVFTGRTANGTHRAETVVFQFADNQSAAEALSYFLDERAEALELVETDPPPVQADEARAITGDVADGNEATVYVRRGRDLFRITAFGGDKPMADLAELFASW